MRKFSSYGPVDKDVHFYAPREDLIDRTLNSLVGENSQKDGHYITVWAPRQTGKSWLMGEVLRKIRKTGKYEAGAFSIESAKQEKNEEELVTLFCQKIAAAFGKKNLPQVKKIKEIPSLFTKQYFQKPVILVIDEFDALEENFINRFTSIFRDIYVNRSYEKERRKKDRGNLLHGLALVGVRSVLGIGNLKGSPFNVQRSLHVSNLTCEEVNGLFKWYEKESGQQVEQQVIDKVFAETRGQPGLTCWFGELLTETYNKEKNKPITPANFTKAYTAATSLLPNANVINIISKAKQEPYRETVLELFRTDRAIDFKFDNPHINFLYMNGVIEPEEVSDTEITVRFANPFLHKRLFNFFSDQLFDVMGKLVEPFDSLEDAVTEESLNIGNILRRYQTYLEKNRRWLFKEAPRRKDMRIFEAVFHFNLYMYLFKFLENKGADVYPEFPTGNGEIDILVKYKNNTYGLELKSYTDVGGYKRALDQAARYGERLRLKEITLVFFIESIDEENRRKYEAAYVEKSSAVKVLPVFISTGE
ncbi:MAG: AAA-like domain-containing protein [Candidatus Aminicenantes bacterium]|nr:AAA-like domain-containing protein [Candidatus Aminicenantes bacterium]